MSKDLLFIIALTLVCVASAYGLARYRPPIANRPLLFVWLAALSVPLFVGGVLLHNMLDALFAVEEPIFFLLAVVGAPLLFIGGLVGASVTGLQIWMRAHGGH